MSEKILEVVHHDAGCAARTSVLHLPHGDVEGPVFMPVGTDGGVKAIYHETLAKMGYRLILGNTYHLYLRPGTDVLDHYGGLHAFSAWNGNLLTDSGGFQVFSMSKLRKLREDGVEFQSHIDGSKHFFTPEKVVGIQGSIGSDIAMCLDVCTSPDTSRRKAEEALDMTHRWAERSLAEFGRLKEGNLRRPHRLFGIMQGNFFEDLRLKSAAFISSLPFDGVAIGGLSVGETPEKFREFLRISAEAAAFDRPRYVMGIGTPEYILEAVENGIDMFDCVLGTRVARHGRVFSDDGVIDITKEKYRMDKSPIAEGCGCICCRQYSRGYLRHLFKAGESLAGMLATEHNLWYFCDLMRRVRAAINADRFGSFKAEYLERYCGR